MYHLGQNNALDSTSNDNDGTVNDATLTTDRFGEPASAYSFEGTADYITIPDSASLDITKSITMSAWVNPDVYQDQAVLGKFGAYGFTLETSGSVNNEVKWVIWGNDWHTGVSVPINQWAHITLTYDFAAGKRYIYKNGQLVGNKPTGGNIPATNNSLVIADFKPKTAASSFNGKIDDVRIASAGRSAEWISTEYNNQSAPSNFYDVGSQEGYYSSYATLTSSIFDTELSSGTWGVLTFTAATPSSTSAIVKVRTSNSSAMSGAADFATCDALTSGSDISGNNCVTDGERYVQYQVSLTSADGVSTPAFQDISIGFAPPPPTPTPTVAPTTAPATTTASSPLATSADTIRPIITLSTLGNVPFNPHLRDWFFPPVPLTLTGITTEPGSAQIVLTKKGYNTSFLNDYGTFLTASVATDTSRHFTFTTPDLPIGEYRLTITSQDGSGNVSHPIDIQLFIAHQLQQDAESSFPASLPSPTPSPTGIKTTQTPTPLPTDKPQTTPTSEQTEESVNVTKSIGQFFAAIGTTVANVLSFAGETIGQTLAFFGTNSSYAVDTTKTGIGNLTVAVGKQTKNVSETAGHAIVQFGYQLIDEPTTISDVTVKALSPTTAKISWQTNHPANGKVNYGFDETYPFDVQTEKRTTYHEFTLTDLQPDTVYHFEVMSHAKNYVYDANRKFKTPPL